MKINMLEEYSKMWLSKKAIEKLTGPEMNNKETLEYIFKSVMLETGTQIHWSSLAHFYKQKKDPYVSVSGHPENVQKAKSMLLQLLELQHSKVILKMDVPHTEHPHMIGKGGKLIKRVMEYTNCHIHFPDGNTSGLCEKSNKVSIAGDPCDIEKARLMIRALLPLVISFDVPSNGYTQRLLETSSFEVKLIQHLFGITIYFKRREKLNLTTVVVRCSQSYFAWHKQGILSLMDYICGKKIELPVTLKTQIVPRNQGFVLGLKGQNVHKIALATSTSITFPERTANDHEKDTININGNLDNVFAAFQELEKYLPVAIVFDVGENHEINADCTGLYQSCEFNVFIKPKPKSNILKIVTIKAAERHSQQLLQFRQHLLKLPPLNFSSSEKEITMASSLFYLTLDNYKYFPPSLNFSMTQDSFWNLRKQLQMNLLVPAPTAVEHIHGAGNYKSGIINEFGKTTVGNQYWHSPTQSRIPSPINGSLPETDYYHKKVLAAQAMHRPIGSPQVPSNAWAGCGFSQSMPAAVIKEKMNCQNQFSPDSPLSPNAVQPQNVWNSDFTDSSEKYDRNIWGMNKGSLFSYSNCFDIMTSESSRSNSKDLLPKLLCQAGLDKYIDIFNKEEIDYEAFLLLSDDDLRNLGVGYGSRTKMISLIRQMQKKDWNQHYDTKKSFQAAPGAERKLNA